MNTTLKCCRLLIAALLLAPLTALAARTNRPPTVSLTAPASGTIYTAPASITLTANAADRDGIARVEFYAGATQIGTSVSAPYAITWDAAPAGTYSLTARATDSLGASATSAAVSITVKASPADLIRSPANGAALYGSAVTVSGVFDGDPRTTSILVDNGNSTRMAKPADNNYSVSVPLFRGPNTLTVVVAREDRTYDTASVTVTGNDAPYVALKQPTQTMFDAPASIELEAEALSPGGSVDRVEFFRDAQLLGTRTAPPYRYSWANPPAGSYNLSARVTDDHGVSTAAARAITVYAPNTLPQVSLTAPADGAQFIAPATVALAAAASDPDGSIVQVEFLRDGALLASDTSAPYGFNWSGVGAGTYVLTARATDNRSGVTTSAPVTVVVSPPNAAPAVTLDDPPSGATFVAPADILLAASAADSDGSIARVEFYAGATLLGSDTAAPYAFPWSGVAAGSYSLTARAVDDQGAATVSPAVAITVNDPPPNVPPSVALTSPPDGTAVYAPAAVSLAASAADSDGMVASVAFYANGALLGTDGAAPYTHDWTGVPAGTYVLTAQASDDSGAVTTSASVTLTVNALGLALTTPQNGVTLAGDQVVVSGTFEAPFNAGITVNGIVAGLEGNSFHANVPLVAGSNTITAVLTTPAGQSVEQSITVYGDGVAPFLEITADRVEGVAPLAVVFTVENDRDVDASVQVGQSSFTVPSRSSLPVTITYGAGVYTARFDATNSTGESMSKRFVIVVQDPAQMDQRFAAMWNGMNDALIAGDKAAAMVYLSAPAQEKYGPVFDVLMPEYAAIVASFSPMYRGVLSGDMGEYVIKRNIDGVSEVFFVYFVRGNDGIWRLDSL